MKKKILKITILNQFNNLKWTLFSSLIYYIMVYLVFKESIFIFDRNNLVIILHIWVLIPFIIVLYIHISYYFENKKTIIKIKDNYIHDLVVNKRIYNVDIKKIIINKSYSTTAGRIPIFPFQRYNYCEVLLNNGEKLILTSLLHYKIDEYLKENLKGVLYENNFSPFCFFLTQ